MVFTIKNNLLLLLILYPFFIRTDTFDKLADLQDKLNILEAQRKQAHLAYLSQEIAKTRSSEQLLQDIKDDKLNPHLRVLLSAFLVQQIQKNIAMIIDASDKSGDITHDIFEKELKPFLCACVCGNKTDQQIAQEIRQAPIDLEQTIIFGFAKQCGRIAQDQDYETYLKQHGINRKN